MKLEIKTRLDDSFMLEWKGLYNEASSTFFDNPTWIISQKKTSEQFYIITIRKDKKLLSVLPMKIQKKYFFFQSINILTHCNSSISDYQGMLCLKSRDCRSVAKLFSEELLAFRTWDVVSFRNIDANDSLLNDILFRAQHFVNVMCSRGVDELIPRSKVNNLELPKKLKGELRRARDKIENLGKVEIIHGIPIDETIIKNLLEYRSTIYPENNDLVAKADIHGFVNLILHPDLKDEILYSELKVNKNTVAKSLCFINNNQLFYYIPIFDREYSSFSPGKILLEDLYCFCEQQEISIINFLRGAEKYKWAWADEFNLTYSFTAVSKGGNFASKCFGLSNNVREIYRYIFK